MCFFLLSFGDLFFLQLLNLFLFCVFESLITSLAKEVMLLVALVCLFVDNITQKVTNGLG